METTTHGPGAAAQLHALKLAARSGHIRRATLALGAMFPRRNHAIVTYHDGARLRIPLSDPFWSRVLVGWEHEPVVHTMLDAALAREPSAKLFDCGANIGYWSARCAPRAEVIAVEPVPDTYARLLETSEINGGFVALRRAVWSEGGETLEVSWTPNRHAAASVTGRRGARVASVETVTLAALHAAFAAGAPVVTKLDVEGAEIPAIQGALPVAHDVLFLYEDHGRDPAHKTTAYLLDHGLTVTSFRGQNPQQIERAEQLDEIKVNDYEGYDFAAHDPRGRWRGWAGD